MASTSFSSTVTKIPADWANDVNTLVYNVFNGSQNLADVQTALGLGALAFQAPNGVSISGGSINGTAIGTLTPASGSFSNLSVTSNGSSATSVVNKSYVDSAISSVASGLGDLSTQNSGAVDINGGTIDGVSIGLSSAASGVFSNLQVTSSPVNSTDVANKAYVDANLVALPAFGTMATQNANAVAVTGGLIDNTVIGGTSPAAASFTNVIANRATGSSGTIALDASIISSAGISLQSTGAARPDVLVGVNSGGNFDVVNSTNNRILRVRDNYRVMIGNNAGDDGVNLLQVYGTGRFDNVVLPSAPTIANHAANKQYVDTQISIVTLGYTNAISAATSGLGSMSSQSATAVNITGGLIEGTSIGITAPAAGRFSTLQTPQTPLASQDVTTKIYVDTQIAVNAMTILSGLGSLSSQNANAVTISGGVLSGVTINSAVGIFNTLSVTAAPTASNDVTTKSYVDNQVAVGATGKANLSGATFTGPVVLASNPVSNLEAATKQYADQLSPPGLIAYFPGSTPPAGYLRANGALVSRTTYANLFARTGTVFGPGDGTTTFQLPTLADLVTGQIYAFIKF